MFRMTSKSARLGLALAAICALAACSDSKPGATAAVSNALSTEPTLVIDGKEWMRCALGQTWEGNTCTGEAETFNFDEAQAAAKALNAQGGAHGKTDWRVPTVRELASLRVCSTGFKEDKSDVEDGGPEISVACKDGSTKPTLDAQQFPNTPSSTFWSSLPYVGGSDYAWLVDFDFGLVGGLNRDDHFPRVRLVRASQ